MDIEFSIYLATRTRWAHLTKTVSLAALPRAGDFVKFNNEKLGDYFAFEVASVTFREGDRVEVMTELLGNVDNRLYSFEDERELDEYVATFLSEGWVCERGIGPNNRLLGKMAR
jgi:hypothetical protein